MGKTIQENVLDGGPIYSHMQGDISKCPYYSAKIGKPYSVVLQKCFRNKSTGLLANYLIISLCVLLLFFLLQLLVEDQHMLI